MQSLWISMYRRHGSNCTKSRKPNDTPFKKTPNAEGITFTAKEASKDCDCRIQCDGVLPNYSGGKYFQRLSLGTSDWKQANATALLWLKWGSTTEPQVDLAENDKPTVEQAITSYLATRNPETGTQKLWTTTYDNYDLFLSRRLLPWCKEHNVTHINQLSKRALVEQFMLSWKQLDTGEELLLSSRKILRAYLRTFLGYCDQNDWIAKNHVPTIKLQDNCAVVSLNDEDDDEGEKHGFTVEEWGWFKQATLNYSSSVRHIVAVFITYETGVRISDVITLADEDIVENREIEEGQTEPATKYAISKIMWKTRRKARRVWVPLPDYVADMYFGLPVINIGRDKMFEGRHFRFWSPTYAQGAAGVESATNTFRYRFGRIYIQATRIAGNEGKHFSHEFAPHILRHTAAHTWLANGMKIEHVSRNLGHATIATTINAYLKNENSDSRRERAAYYRRQAEAAKESKPFLVT